MGSRCCFLCLLFLRQYRGHLELGGLPFALPSTTCPRGQTQQRDTPCVVGEGLFCVVYFLKDAKLPRKKGNQETRLGDPFGSLRTHLLNQNLAVCKTAPEHALSLKEDSHWWCQEM